MLPIAAVMHKTSINGIFEQAFGRHACGLLGNISFGLCHFIFARELQTSMPAYHPVSERAVLWKGTGAQICNSKGHRREGRRSGSIYHDADSRWAHALYRCTRANHANRK